MRPAGWKADPGRAARESGEEPPLPPGSVSTRVQLLIVGCAVVLLLTRLGATDLWAPDEPRYGQVAAELHSMRHGARGLVLLHLNDAPYNQKPPLYYWLAALVGAIPGQVTETAARLPSALAGIGLVALTLRFGARLLGGASGALGAAFLLTTVVFAHLSRRVQLDVVLTLFETLALLWFWRLDRGLGAPRRQIAGLHAALGLAVLTKGPVGVLVPTAVMAAYLIWERRPRQLARAFPPWALLLSLGPGLAWLAAVLALAPGGFFDEAVVENLLGRFLAGTSHARPFYYYLYQLPLDLLPWTLLAPVVAWVGWRRVFADGAAPERARSWRFLLAWVGASLLFFSLSSGKRGLYLLPAFPAAALLFADAAVRWVEARGELPRAFALASGVVAGIVVVAGVGFALRDPLAAPTTSRNLGLAVVAIVIAAALAWRIAPHLWGHPLARVAVTVGAAFAIELLAFTVAWPALNGEKSPRPLAAAAARLTPPHQPVGLVGNRALVGGLRYYGGRPVAELRDAESIADFVARDGRAIVVRSRQLDRVEAVTPVELRFRARSGSRALLVVEPRRDAAR